MAIFETNDPLVQFCGTIRYDIMFSCAAKLLRYFANGPAKDVADLRSEILAFRPHHILQTAVSGIGCRMRGGAGTVMLKAQPTSQKGQDRCQ
jgi:hypothetical protein